MLELGVYVSPSRALVTSLSQLVYLQLVIEWHESWENLERTQCLYFHYQSYFYLTIPALPASLQRLLLHQYYGKKVSQKLSFYVPNSLQIDLKIQWVRSHTVASKKWNIKVEMIMENEAYKMTNNKRYNKSILKIYF